MYFQVYVTSSMLHLLQFHSDSRNMQWLLLQVP